MSAVSPCPRGPGGNSAAFSLGWGASAIFRSCGSTLVSEPLDVWAGSSTCGQAAASHYFMCLQLLEQLLLLLLLSSPGRCLQGRT